MRTFEPKALVTEAPRGVTPEAAPATGPLETYKRPSPSPSVKRGKAERLLKEHGSPPGLRVTAGGRIVPGDLPPLGARPSFNIYNPQALRAAPGNIMAAQPQAASDNTARIEIIGGQPILVVGERMFALPTVSSGSTMPNTTPAVDDTIAKHAKVIAPVSDQGASHGLTFQPPRSSAQTPFEGLDLATLKTQQVLKKQELRTVEQTEVLQSGHQTEAWRANMIDKKKSLIVELDALRKHIATLESDPSTIKQTPSVTPIGAIAAPTALPSFVSSFQQPLHQSIYSYPPTNPYTPMMMYPPSFGAFSSFASMDPTPLVAPRSTSLAHSPGSTNRRSRAIEIKPPHEESKKQAVSILDPKSPTYEPKNVSTKEVVPPTPSPNKSSSWRKEESSQPEDQTRHTLSHKPSLSSVDTTDFFPTNAHEHSSTRMAPSNNAPPQAHDENSVTPTTPEKSWPASPWNEGSITRLREVTPAPKIGSWPEAFGKPQAVSPVKQVTRDVPAGTTYTHASQTASSLHTASSNIILTHDRPQLRIATEDLWPSKVSSPLAKIPSSYHEGFQAGYDHIGMPDSADVLQGYIQGLLAFLADSLSNRRSNTSGQGPRTQNSDSRAPSLHGLVAGSTSHDSAISLALSHAEAQSGSQENVRAGQGHGTSSSRRESAYSPHDTTRNATTFLTQGGGFAQELRHFNDSSSKYPNPTGLLPGGYRHCSVYPSPEQDLNKTQEKGTAPRSSSQAMNDGFGHQLSGSMLASRTNANHQPLQRFYPAYREVGPSGFGGGSIRSAGWPFANNRISGLDGAMDDLADLVMETSVDGGQSRVDRTAQPEVMAPLDAEETGASCFKPSGGKGKQKMTWSPSKTVGSAQSMATSSPANVPASPKKSGEHSPAKAKLEHVTNRFRRSKKDDPRGMTPEERVTRSEKWRKRFDSLKQTEKAEIDKYREDESRRNGGRR